MNSILFQKLKGHVDNLSRNQKIALFAVTAFAIFGLVMLFVWANQPEYALLYSKLDVADTSKILDDLKANNMDYKLEDGGSAIFVRKENVYELRIRYAGEGLVSTGAVGYELFDQNNLGLTDFMQKVNLKRALEGELSNTINQIEAIQQSRVHLVIPEKTLFEDQQKKSTASVVLKLRSQTSLGTKQVTGIANLIAASVEGLEPENVIIVDTFGKVLTKKRENDDEIGLSSSQYELQRNVENHLSNKAQSMLDRVLGENNSIVRISAQLDFDRLERTSEKVDPDNVVIVSEERNEETTTNTDTTLHKRENSVTNYELNKVVEHYRGSTGDITNLSVAVFVNGVYKSPEEPNVLRDDDEIQKITDIVKNAIGFSTERNDQISVEQLAFDRSLIDRENELMATVEERETTMGYIKVGVGFVGAIVLLVVLKKLMKRFGIDDYIKQQRDLLLKEAEASIEDAIEQKEITDSERKKRLEEETKARLEYQERVSNDVKEYAQDTERTTRILRYWLIDEDD